jgi:hypothetical protein
MTLLPQVRSQLDAAAHRKVTARRRLVGRRTGHARGSTRVRLRVIGRNIPVALSLVTALLIAVVAVAVLHHRHAGPSKPPKHATTSGSHPPPKLIGAPTPAQRAIEADIGRASYDTTQSDHACVRNNRGPTTLQGAPGPSLLAQLGVLRRPETPSSTLQTLLGDGFLAGSRVYINYIRLARIAYGRAFYLIPEGNPSGLGSIPARCYTEMRARLKHIIINLPASEQESALTQQAQGLQSMRQRTDQPRLCLAGVTTRHVRPPNGVSLGCSSTTSFRQPGLGGGIGLGDRAGGQIFAAIVPDRVASVTLYFSSSSEDPARTLTSHAVNNVVVFKIPPHTPHAEFPTTIIRRAANGQITSKTTSRGSSSALDWRTPALTPLLHRP